MPELMRFGQVDPLIEVGQHSLTSYHYSFNNPILFSDPDGLLGSNPPNRYEKLITWAKNLVSSDGKTRSEAIQTAVDKIPGMQAWRMVNKMVTGEKISVAERIVGNIDYASMALGITSLESVNAKISVSSINEEAISTKPRETKGVNINICRSKYPEAAAHIDDATAAGHPNSGLIDRKGASARRRESLKDIKSQPNKDRDEFPPAVLTTGGRGASVRLISKSDNRGAGASMGAQIKNLPDGTKVNITTKD